MRVIIAFICRRIALAVILALSLLAGSSVSAGTLPAPPLKKLQDMAAWDAYGLGGGILANMVTDSNGFSGKLHLADVPDELSPVVIGFKSSNQRLFNLALIYANKSLVSLVPALRSTAIADLDLPQLVVLLSPPANAGARIQLPGDAGTVRMPVGGGTTITLNAGASVIARGNADGYTGALLQAVGLPSRDITLSGNIDPRMLSGAGMKNLRLQDDLINGIELRVALGATLDRKPAYLTFGESVLGMKGVSGKIAVGIATSLTVQVDRGSLRFEHVTITRDPVKRQVTIASTGSTPGGNFLTLPVAGATITQVVFHGLIDEQTPANDRFALDGQYVVAGSAPRAFTATLSGGRPAQYVVTVQTDTTLGQLMGWSPPGLNALVLKDVVFGNEYILGDLSLNGLKFTVALFKGAGQTKFNAAFLDNDTFSLPKLLSGLQGTPLADLDLAGPAFVLVPQENVGHGIKLPDPVARHVGVPTADFKYGLNLIAHANAHGAVAELLKSVGLSSSNLLITGTLDAAILASADGALTDAVVNATTLQAVLPAAAPQRTPAYLTFGESVLGMKGVSGKIAVGIATSLTVQVDRGSLRFEHVTITRDPVKRQVTIASTGSTPGGNFLTLPVAGAAITQVVFHGLIDEQTPANDRFTLDGQYVVAGSAPRAFTATLSGGRPAQYVVTVQTDTTLGQLMGWREPSLDAVVLKDVVFGNNYASGNVSLRGIAFTVVVFKGAGQGKSNAAFLSDETFNLPKMMSALQGTPVADLELTHPGFVLVPKENAGTSIKLPEAVARHAGAPTVALKPGLNLIANGNAYGDLAALLDRLGINPKGLPIAGTLDPAIFSGVDAASLAQPFLDALDLRIPLQNVGLPGVAHNVTIGNAYLALKGLAKGIDASVAAKITVTAGAGQAVFDTSFRLIKAASGNTVSIAGDYPGAWTSPFGIQWLNIRNLKIAGSLGQTSALSVAGTTDLGSVRNLTVSVDLTKGDGGTDVVLQLTGADVPLADIPGLSSIPHIGGLKFRDLLLSARAVGGTLKSPTLPLLHDLQAVAFELGGHWNLAAALGDIDLSRLLPLPRFAQPVLGKLKLDKAVLLLSQAAISGRVADLPRAAQAHLLEIYGSPEGTIRAASGVSIACRFDPSGMGPAVTALLPPGQQVVLQGSVSGVVGGGASSLALSATIPSVALPHSLGFIHLPSNARTAFVIRLSEASASTGVEIEAVIGAKLNKQTVDFDSTIAFEMDSQGGVAVDLQGTSLNPWRNVMGINGLSLDIGTRLELETAATSGLTLKFFGKTHIGSRVADAAGSASILGGVVDKGAFEVKLNELTLSDVVALFNDAVQAGGGQPVKADFPDAKLTNVDIAFASPGTNLPELNLPNGGSRLAGDLWFLLKDKPLTRVKGQTSDSSLALSGDIGDFTLGPVAMKGNSLNIRAQTMPPLPPEFKIRGGATIMKRQVSGEVDGGLTETAFVASVDLGKLLDLDLHASFETPAAGLNPGALASQDMALNGHLKSDVGAWLRTEGKAAVAKVFESVGSGIKRLIADVDAAQKKVDELNGQLGQARARANADAKTVDQQIAQAQKKVDGLAARVNSLKNDIDSEKGAIHGCDYSIKICYWWNWKGHCTKHKDVPDVRRDAECEANNARHAAVLAGYETALKSAQAAKVAADAVLAGIKKGEKGVDLASLDPEVIALEASLEIAHVALDAAKLAAQGAELGVEQLKAGLEALDRLDTFSLTGATISGKLQKAVAGQPIVLGLEFEAARKRQHLQLALSLTDPEYNTKQFETLALLVAKDAVEALPGAAPAVTHLLNDAFKSRHDAADKEVDQAVKANGLE